MKRSCWRLFCLALGVLLVISGSAAAPASSSSVRFAGFSDGFEFQPGSEYTATDLFQNFKAAMPGDVLTEEITFTNSAAQSDLVQVYLRAVVHDETAAPLSAKVAETETVASMRAFLSQLSMRVWNGTALIFDAAPDELCGLAGDVLLGTFRTGQTTTLKVELTVPETLDNRFASRVGEVDWVFRAEACTQSLLTVRKIWSDGNAAHAGERITVHVLQDGRVRESAVLSADNGWACAFGALPTGNWTVEEVEVPDGYSVHYETRGSVVTITNTKNAVPEEKEPAPPAGEPLDLVVQKTWSGDEATARPECVSVTLYDGDAAYETVELRAENGWTYHWCAPAAFGNWQVVESDVPEGYTPAYSVSGNVTTITNTAQLIRAGQRSWLIAALGGAGLALLTLGGGMLQVRKRRRNG